MGRPDGLGAGEDVQAVALDLDGRLYVAAFLLDEVQVYAPDGSLERRISTGAGSRPTNLCFAGQDLDRLVVTVARGGRMLEVSGRFPGRAPSPWIPRRAG